MKIIIDTRILNNTSYGGIREYARKLLPPLFSAGENHEFHLFENAYKKSTFFNEFPLFSNVYHHRYYYPNKALTFSLRYLNTPRIDEMVGGGDVLFAPHFIPAPVSSKCKKVITFHDISFEYFPEFFNWKRRLWHKYLSPKRQAHSATRIIAVSNSTKEDLHSCYDIPEDKMSVIHLGPENNGSDFNPLSWDDVAKKYSINSEYILSLSTIEPRKNINGLVRAFSVFMSRQKNPRHTLVIAGNFGWSYDDIIKEVRKSPYSDYINIIGPVTDLEKNHLYKNASLFVYPSLYEGFGLPPLEAMAHGVPTIVSYTSSLPEVVKDAALFVDPYRPDMIARVMEEVVFDAKLRNVIKEKGRERAKEFKWDKVARETLDILEGV